MVAIVLMKAKIANVYCSTLIGIAIAFDLCSIPGLPPGPNASQGPPSTAQKKWGRIGLSNRQPMMSQFLEAELRVGQSEKEKAKESADSLHYGFVRFGKNVRVGMRCALCMLPLDYRLLVYVLRG